MIHFEWVWAFLLLPLPLLIYYILPPVSSSQQAALRVPFIEDFGLAHTSARHTGKQSPGFWLAFFTWCVLVVAMARPQWLGDAIELPVSGRDLMLAVDLSGSMETKDFEINHQVVDRLTATKYVAGDFIERRVGDRLGLILFGRNAYLQTPLTFDRETVKTLLDESVIGLAGKETAIGDAIGLAVKRLKQARESARQLQGKEASADQRSEQQILVLLTDGANTAGEVDPVKAAELAADEGLKIYTIGIGADEMLVRSLFGMRRVNPSADLDEKTLKAIAEKTGGKYFRARDSDELKGIYTLLDKLEPIVQETQSFRPHTTLFQWPLTLALLLAAGLLLKTCWRGRLA